MYIPTKPDGSLNWLVTYFPLVIVTPLLLILGWYADTVNQRDYERELRQIVLNQANIIRAKLEGNINSNAHLIQGLVTAITIEPELSQERYEAFAEPLFRGQGQLRNIGAAPGLVIRYMYPIAGNEAAIGLDYRATPRQLEAVSRAIKTNKLILAGPVTLVQGGRGFIARIPIFLNNTGNNKERLWGIVSAVIDADKLYQASGLLDTDRGITLGLRGKDARGGEGTVFFGDESLFHTDAVFVDVTLPNGSWQLAARPDVGWRIPAETALPFRVGLALAGLLTLFLIFFLSRFIEKKRLSDQRFVQLFNSTPIATGIVTKEGIITDLNDQFRTMFGYDNNDIPTIEDWAKRAYPDPEYRIQVFETWNAEVKKAVKENRGITPLEYQITRSDGQIRTVEISGRAIDNNILATFSDITERKQIEAALLESNKQLELVIDSTAVGIWDWQVQTGEVIFNERWAEIIGYTLDELKPINIDTWLKYTHPDDLEESGKLLEAHWQGETDRYICEARMKHKNGHWAWVLDTGSTVEWHDDGKPKRMIGTHLDITERKLAEQELTKARNEAENANQAKSQFLSNMSHELRTPLNAILGFSQLLEMDLKGVHRDNAVEILTAGKHLLSLINEILDLSKIESGSITMVMKDLSLNEIIYECVSILNPIADTRNIEIINNIPAKENYTIKADEVRIKQILMNLISNAIKYNREAGTVTIGCNNNSSGLLRIMVEDTGEGLTNEQATHLFKPFERIDMETSSIEGTGLGLVICKQLIELMDGNIGIESTPGTGSTFWFEIPVSV